jgi:hypothetical protein
VRKSYGAIPILAWRWIKSSLSPHLTTRRRGLALVYVLTLATIIPVVFGQTTPTPNSIPPLSLERVPPGTPQVTWDGSLLTIITNNSTLADILAAVHAKTGAEIDMPESASRERTAARLGPGPIREVLSSLLSWTGFNYVIQASDKNPDGIQSILLIPRPKDAIEVATNSARPARGEGYRPSPEPEPNSNLEETRDPSETPVTTQSETAVESVPPTQPTPQSVAQPAGSDPQPAVADLQPSPANSRTAATTPDPTPASDQPKVPSQMIQQLQSMYQQRLRLQENENQKPTTDQSP